MKLVTFLRGTEARPGALVGDDVLDLNDALAWHEEDQSRDASTQAISIRYGGSILGLIERQNSAMPVVESLLKRAREKELSQFLTPLSQLTLLAPIPRPPSMRDGYAFRQHVEAARRNRGVPMIPEFDLFPVFYFTNHNAVCGPGELAVRPMQAERLDFELEAAIVLGKSGRDIKAENADEYVFGYMIMNDWSARKVQIEEMTLSLGPAKGKDFATGLGPILVTVDELEPYKISSPQGNRYDLGMRAWVNGVQLSTGNVKDMTWTFAQILERVSYGVNILPGEVIGSGTVGTGCLLELNGSKITNNQWLQNGDQVVLEIDHLGRLENTIRLID